MNIEKEAFELYFLSDEELKVEFKRLMDLLMEDGLSTLEATRKIRQAASHYFSYKATEEQKDAYSIVRRKRCYDVVINNDAEGGAFLTTIYGLNAGEMVTYARSHPGKIKNKEDFEVAGRKFVAASKKRQNAVPETKETYIGLAKKICYSGFKQLSSFLNRLRINDDYFKKMVAYLKENNPDIYDNLMMNIKVANIINSTNVDEIAEGLELVNSIREKIINNPDYTVLDYYKDTKGLSTARFYALYIVHYNITNDSSYKKMAKFLKGVDEVDNVFSATTSVSKARKNDDGEIVYKHYTEEERNKVFRYIQHKGLPCSMYIYGTGLEMIENNPDFFTIIEPKKS